MSGKVGNRVNRFSSLCHEGRNIPVSWLKVAEYASTNVHNDERPRNRPDRRRIVGGRAVKSSDPETIVNRVCCMSLRVKEPPVRVLPHELYPRRAGAVLRGTTCRRVVLADELANCTIKVQYGLLVFPKRLERLRCSAGG
jgi:hypothetical protein